MTTSLIRFSTLIEKTLEGIPFDGTDDEEELEAGSRFRTARGLYLAAATKWRYHTIDLRYWSKVKGLWDLAIQAVDKMIRASGQRGWNDPAAKAGALNELKIDLERAKEECKDMKEQALAKRASLNLIAE